MNVVKQMEQNYQPISCKSALNHINSKFLPYHWDLNIYRGCEHQCAYCYAQYSHSYLEDTDFFHHIYIKENIVTQLEQKLQSSKWAHDVINLGGVTDSYQPAEAIYKLMPQILKLLIKYKTPAIISTKSSLILRDIDLLKELSNVAGVQVAITITTLDQSLANKIEPGASSIKERINTIYELKKAGLTVGWHLMPMIPYLTATRNNLTAIFKIAQMCQIDYIIPGILNLRGSTRINFFRFMKNNYPNEYDRVWKLYNNKNEYKQYKHQLQELISTLSKQYSVSRNYYRYVPKVKESKIKQITFFDE